VNTGWEDEDDEALGEDGSGTMVRPYTITRGRTAPERDDFTLITVLRTADEPRDGRGVPVLGLQPPGAHRGTG
jgi:hypothetical protein